MSEWMTIVGLEVHAEMLTETKMFSACPVVDSVTAPPNTAVDPLSLGMPGTLPVINMKAMDMGMMVGLALNCEIPAFNQFARKNYFYPDLPKGYQISQYEHPLATNGYLDIELEDGTTKRIGVTRAHMEEDTGKLTHISGGSLVDYNRAGVPLLEIVSEPDIRSSAEAEAYARKLRAILQYLGVNHGDMSKGVLRFEANVSVMHKDDTEFRTRTEIKNLNSIRSMVRAIDKEVKRQIKLWESGEGVKQATLGWDENAGKIIIQRYKERPDEYRYFPEPDLPIVEVSREWVARIRATLPELPDAKRARYIEELGITPYDAHVLTLEQSVAKYFDDVVAAGADAKAAANWMTGDLFRVLNEANVDRDNINETPLTASHFAGLIKVVDDGIINAATARKDVLPLMLESGQDANTIVQEKGLAQISDPTLIADKVQEAIDGNADMVAKYLDGNEKVINALFGRTMGALKGKGDPAVVRQVLLEKLQAMKA
ncbi:Asp-tRNA(Asn)/Glu-tRNA(Gln) amidotransferase subunit GatB [Phototrophicus methaneseepsis]|uniref:Aspartyl/glutamyl-tRNA(Asn/Gln) amidotransferase subunit B n=1 Tax=Phototrophicus methaneseepsis TaxID=2710758 RepID=A0A7S8E8I1_9CHLR|nr:Asp-tRNA(Asn)/Glu-tRNA(Gln) amidotransferase subunit GatB [Phototrophicus methaneseepsis]QPC82326.1 Asp-tRNA(Asn)/Glu-tRNA(Gln) amidotransferase subunit GatB [Phototrophicus methaneseepsis]